MKMESGRVGGDIRFMGERKLMSLLFDGLCAYLCLDGIRRYLSTTYSNIYQ